MTKQFTFLGQVRLFILMMILMSLIKTSDGRKDEKFLLNSEDDDSSDEDRRAYELKKLRHFLLTSNADERAAKREKQDFLKRELVKEYLRAAEDSDSSRLEEVKKRFKTWCTSYEQYTNSKSSTCG